MRKEEQALQDFYYWELRYRGWALFDYPVDSEVPFVPFPSRSTYFESYVDDGKSLSLIQKMKGIIRGKEEVIEEEPRVIYEHPKRTEPNRNQVVSILSLGREYRFDRAVWCEVLETLSLCRHTLSFEIISTADDIQVQIVCHQYDNDRVNAHLLAYFPSIKIVEGDQWVLPYDEDGADIGIVDFGLKDESMLPLAVPERVQTDPLLSLITLFEQLDYGECAVFQVMFKGTNAPLSSHFKYAVSDGMGGSFLADVPELVSGCDIKRASSLLSVGIRLAVQGATQERSEYLLEQGILAITKHTESEYNQLIPLSNQEYDYNAHVMNSFYRSSYRHGMILSVNELVSLVHYPSSDIVSAKLYGVNQKTKAIPPPFVQQTYTLGINIHEGIETAVSLSDDMRLKHTHVLGATGMGKSTWLANMLIQDISIGNGCALFDPHGDIVEDVLVRIPEHRHKDIIIIDPRDTEYPVGFNLLQASNEAEKLVLSSDLVSAFRSTATSWGDTMTSVLSNAIDTFLDSSEGGTLIELKRFLLEDAFRKEFLHTVSDPQLLYYWEKEYGMVKKRISPLLTRMDTFLRPKVIRSMMVQKEGVDIAKALNKKKIILFKLSIGLIGKENASLLGSLFLSKLNQVALGRQDIPKEERHPFYVYLDECHHFMSPSVSDMLSGVRKYGLGLVLAHQDLKQIRDEETLALMLSMPYTRVCFRTGDTDAKRLEQGFSFFDSEDLMNLERGETIIRLGQKSHDVNMETSTLREETMTSELRYDIIQYSREQYGTPQEEIEALFQKIYGTTPTEAQSPLTDADTLSERKEAGTEEKTTSGVSKKAQEDILKRATTKEQIREHRTLQRFVKKLGQDNGFVSEVEYELESGKRIDVSLRNSDLNIACEISVTNTVSYELGNITKCFDAGYDMVCVIANNESHLNAIEQKAKKELSTSLRKKIFFLESTQMEVFLSSTKPKDEPPTEIVKGYRVKTEFVGGGENETEQFRKDIERILRKRRK